MYEVYKIEELDTIDTIANKYGIDKEILKQINGLLNDNINNLEYLVVPQNKTPFQYYTVKKGDNIYSIAKKYNIDEDLLLKLNGLNKTDYIYPNQTIIIPKQNYRIYLTKKGDTLSNISSYLDRDIFDLYEENRNISVSEEQIIIVKEK